jgi:hypothetical protein
MLANTTQIRKIVRTLNSNKVWYKNYTDQHKDRSLRRLCFMIEDTAKIAKELGFILALLGYSNKITVSKRGYLRVVAPLSA